MTPNTSSKSIDIDEVIRDIQKGLKEIKDRLSKNGASDKEWTREVLTKIGKLAKDHGSLAYTSKGEPKRGEWLYDLCWLDYEGDGEKAKLLRMPLALESEWGTDQDVADDFQKLMVSRAELRVMVFGGRNTTTEKTVDLLASYVRSFKDGAESDRYLLAGYDGDKIGFRFFVLNGNGEPVE